jgi:hypothetical protein
MNAIITRRLVNAARRTKVMVERCITTTVRLHGRVLDKQVAKAYDGAELCDKQGDIIAAALSDIREQAECMWDDAADLQAAVNAEKRSLGL